MTVPPAAAAETQMPTMINDDEFVENGTVTYSDKMNHDDGTTKSDSAPPPPHHKWIWLKATFHCLVTLVGVGVLGYAYATSWLGFGGAAVLITTACISAYYTASLLSGLQEPDQKTYIDIGKAVGARGWHIIFFRLVLDFSANAIMILLGGEALHAIDLLTHNATVTYLGGNCGEFIIDREASKLSARVWILIMGCFVLLPSMTKDLSSMWQISAIGTASVIAIVLCSIVGSIIAFSDKYKATYDGRECVAANEIYAAELLTAFGSIIFGFGYHSVQPDIQSSLLIETDPNNLHKDMKKAIIAAFSIALLSYLVVALLGFAAFGESVASDLLLSLELTKVVSEAGMIVIWVFVIIVAATEGAIINQAAFSMCFQLLGISKRSYDVIFRLVYIVAGTLVAMYVPFFADLTAITGALSITPLSFIYPVVFWNMKHKADATKWRLRFHYVFIAVWASIGAAALAGAIWSLKLKLGSE